MFAGGTLAFLWAVITLAKDIDFHWALCYGKYPRSFASNVTGKSGLKIEREGEGVKLSLAN